MKYPKQKWLFHFRIGIDNSNHNATGLGHAKRCLRLIEEATKHNIKCFVISSENKATRSFLASADIDFDKESNILKLTDDFDVIVSDINYLEKDFFDCYRKIGKNIVSIAPRGQSKYYADIAILDLDYVDEKPEKNNSKNRIFSNVDFTVTGPGFNAIKTKIENQNIKKENNTIVIFMGGVDNNNLTQKVVNYILDMKKDFILNIILTRANQNAKDIQKLKRDESLQVNFFIDPINFYEIISKCKFGVFSAGISSYEAAGLGTVPLNISISNFHRQRGLEMEKKNIGIYLGGITDFGHKLKDFLDEVDIKQINNLAKSGMQQINGNGSVKIIQKIISEINK